MTMKKGVCLILALLLLAAQGLSLAENQSAGTPPGGFEGQAAKGASPKATAL